MAIVAAATVAASASLVAGPAGAAAPSGAGDDNTATPIKHVVTIIGENDTFDNVFGTYQPPAGQHVDNLLSEGIVNASGAAGPNASKAQQSQATDTTSYQVDPTSTAPYSTLPKPNTTSTSKACTGQGQNVDDAPLPSDLANVPYPITKYVPYFDDHGQYNQFGTCEFNGAVVGDPLHRFYQSTRRCPATSSIQRAPTTCGHGSTRPPAIPTAIRRPRRRRTRTRARLDMGYYNMAAGDAPIFRYLAEHYAMSDDYHQSVMGGTGANHIMLGTGDAAYYQDSQGHATAPPSGEIENPNPQPGTNNFYTQDGYGKSGTTNGGSYSNCSDATQPGVSGVDALLNSLPYKTFNNGDCAPGHYYLFNNYNPGYNVDGTLNTSTFTVPPQQSTNTIADELQAKHVSWGYYGEGYNNGNVGPNYCGVCDPFQYATSVMANPAKRANVQHGLSDFDASVANNTLPAVSYLKPGDDDGHPGYSTLAVFENFVSHTVSEIQNQPKLWKSTAIFITFDEGGGYYDSGPVQPVSYFGDGTRVPMLVVSPYTKAGHVDHSYTDHVSTLKFIEANWTLNPLSSRSLDNLPDPRQTNGSYLPQNPPAIGDLMGLFDFGQAQPDTAKPPPGNGPPPHDSQSGGGSGGSSQSH